MLKRIKFFQKIFQTSPQEQYEVLLKDKLTHLNLFEYCYNPALAVDELGLDEEIVNQLVDDYVIQVIKSTAQFDRYIETLQDSKGHNLILDYTPFRELAHKNLGVARNLRIKDAEVLLYELMKKEDLEYLISCLEALKLCAIRLRPQCAYDTLKLIEVKKAL